MQQNSSRTALLGVLAAAAIAMQVLEAPLPRPLPWLKPGLANSTTIVALLLFGLPSALLLILVRQISANLLLGSLLSPSFLIGLMGSATAGVVMSITLKAGRQRLGLVSISVLGALSNNLAQLLVVSSILEHSAVWYQLPFMMFASIPSGILIGLLSSLILARIPPGLTGNSPQQGNIP